MQLLQSIKHIILFVGLIAGISACGVDDDDKTYNYTVTSATWFTGGQQVAVIRIKHPNSCADHTNDGEPERVGVGAVDSPGTVSFSFTTGITSSFFESVYIDNNANGNLDNGDRVWGDEPDKTWGYCFDSLSADQYFDWEVVAQQIQSSGGLSQPSIIYTGPPKTFRGEPGSEPESMIYNAIIVDVDGYNSIQW